MRTLIGMWTLNGSLILEADSWSLAHVFGLSEDIGSVEFDLRSGGKVKVW